MSNKGQRQMNIIELCDADKRYLSYLLTRGSDARTEPLTTRHLLDNGYIVERHIGGKSFEYSASSACREYFEHRMDELKVSLGQPQGPIGGCNFGC